MRTALYVPTINDYGADPTRLVTLARAAEAAGYDGFFLWDHLVFGGGETPVADAVVMLGALAQATERLILGALVTPLSRRRPWKFAKELATLDRLSNGRIVCGVGLGEPVSADFVPFGEDASPLGRARGLDEGLALLDPLLRGAIVTHQGPRYRLQDAQLAPASLQSPRVPIWVAAVQPAQPGFRRAARWEGCFPLKFPAAVLAGGLQSATWPEWWLTPREFAASAAQLRAGRSGLETPFDLLASGRTIYDTTPAMDTLTDYANAGATWWLEWVDEQPGSYELTLRAVQRGAPRLYRTPDSMTALQRALLALHQEIDHAANGDRQALQELQRLINEAEYAINAPAQPPPQSLRGRLERLEFAHPRATAILNDISMTLSNLGI